NAGSVSATLVQGVNQAATTTIVTSSISQSASGQIVTFTATVTINPPGAGTPTGSVSFVADGSNTVCSAVPLQSGTAVCSTSSFAPGSHTVVATYSGDADLTSSNGQIQVNVNSNQAATSTALTSSPNPSVFGQAVTFTATVTVNAPGSGTPTGTMSFQADGPNSLCASVLLDANGMANCTVSSLALGKHMITANYTPNSNLGASFAVTYQNVNQATTSTAVISSPNPSVFGQAVTLTATVTVNAPGSGIPTGTVTFTDGSSAVCAKVPLGSNVTAICTINTLATGMHAITATYSGDGNFMPSGGQSSQTITKDATNTQVSSSASVLTVGQTVTFTATVKATPPGSGTATGTVSFMANGSITLCASVALQPNGTASCTVGNLSSGSQSITATYTGDQNFLGSSNSTSVTVNAQTAGGTADLAIKQIEDHKVVQGQLFAYSIRVTNMGPNSANIVIMNDALPSGTVFLESKQSAGSCAGPAIGTSGAVTCTTPRLEPGHSWQIFITVKITAPRGTVVTNTATVGSTTSDPNLSNNQASVNLLVVLPRDNRETAK
ncbi:MAG TPA: Ig-like domain repeat protein, partial [Bryobacteraceae bacterium]|nr:Ig-like domain repeat protein [Bryobacteraceae bacterium]